MKNMLNNKAPRLVIGVIGKIGAGKDYLAGYLQQKYDACVVSTGDIVREKAGKEGMDKSRSSLQRAARKYLDEHGEDYFARLAIRRIEQDSSDMYALSGLRTPSDVKTMRDHYGDKFILAHIEVIYPYARYERLQKRKAPRDPDTMDQLEAQDALENELFDLEKAIKMADVRIPNNGTESAYRRNIKKQLIRPHVKSVIGESRQA